IPTVVPFATVEGVAFSKVLATSTDADPGRNINDYTVTINWRDGNTSTGSAADGTITAGPGTAFTIHGSHKYAAAGSYAVLVTVADNGGASKTSSLLATVADAPLTPIAVPVSATEGTHL